MSTRTIHIADEAGWRAAWVCGIDVINVCNVYEKFSINAFVMFVDVYFNKRHVKCRNS